MDVKTAILSRRSIRKYKSEPVSDDLIYELLEAARWAPSGTNHQPWRFVVVRDSEVKQRIKDAAFNQKFLTEAPVLLVCCADVNTYSQNTRKRVQELVDAGVFESETLETYPGLNQPQDSESLKKFVPHAMLNVAIALQNIALRAVELGLGTCYVQLMKASQIAEILGLPKNLVVTALMPVGYPDQNPPPRPRVVHEEIIYKQI